MFKNEKKLREAEDFQPDAIMLESKRPPVSMHVVWFLIVGLLLVMILWASFAKMDKIVTADGKIVTTRPPITMKPYERTVIKKVHIHQGQRVKAGQILFTFDPTLTKADYQKYLEQAQSLKAQKERLQAEMLGYKKDRIIADKPNSDEVAQNGIYLARKKYYEEKMRYYQENIIRYEKTLEALKESMIRFQDRKNALGRIEKMMRELSDKKIVSLKDLLNTQVQFIEMEISIDQQKVSIVENTQQIQSIKADRNAFIKDWDRQIMEEKVNVERELISVNRELPKAHRLDALQELRSPCDAVVHELAPFQEGSAVREAESLVTLIPLNVELEVEVQIPAKDISWVKKDSKARIKLDAFPFQQCGTLDGTVHYISQDAFQKGVNSAEQMEDNEDGGAARKSSMGVTFQANLKISGKLKGRGFQAPLLPGMRLKAEIKVGERTVINYVLNPFFKALDEAAREP